MVLAGLLCSLLGLLCKDTQVIQVESLPPAPSSFSCLLDPEPGTCLELTSRYYYNYGKGQCEVFDYYGCGGNQNNFETEIECLIACGSVMEQENKDKKKQKGKGSKDDTCSLEPNPGPCKAAFQRFYYDPSSETCKTFIYGGCRGNDNNFVTEDDCIQECGSTCFQTPDPGPCRGAFRRFYYDPESKSCKRFIYGGCKGNDNNYKTEAACQEECGHIQDKTGDGGEEEEPKDDTCSLEPKTGPCRAAIPRYYYDTSSESCKTFTYGGCGGNENNFYTEDECLQQCGHKDDGTGDGGEEGEPTDDTCSLEPKTGPCRAIIPRYYYDPSSESCKTFNYGGCQGNENNFYTEDECLQQCGPTQDKRDDGKKPKDNVCSLKPKRGPCRAAIRRFYYNSKSGKCKLFIYGGCRGNDNNFSTKDECIQRCVEEEEEENTEEEECDEDDEEPSICQLPSDSGPCEAAIPAYFYNYAEKECQQFTYGGCEGNANNFETLEECQLECGTSHSRGW